MFGGMATQLGKILSGKTSLHLAKCASWARCWPPVNKQQNTVFSNQAWCSRRHLAVLFRAFQVGRPVTLVWVAYKVGCVIVGVTTTAKNLAWFAASETATVSGLLFGYYMIQRLLCNQQSMPSPDPPGVQQNLLTIPKALQSLFIADLKGPIGSISLLAVQTLCRRHFRL